MGFSPLGLAVAVAVLAPNLLLVIEPPRGRAPSRRAPTILTWLERAGQGLCLVVPVITTPGTLRWWWLVPMTGALACYYALWGRYLLAGRSNALLYGPVWGVPVPMALLPVLVFLAAGLWLDDLWIVGAGLVLAVGHIPASAFLARSLAAPR